MVARVRPVQHGKALGVRGPVEITAVHDDAADRGAVPADIFGGGMDDDRGPVRERPGEHRGCRVVDDERDAELAPDGGDLGQGKTSSLGSGNVSAK